jgi:hypothetical protein
LTGRADAGVQGAERVIGLLVEGIARARASAPAEGA